MRLKSLFFVQIVIFCHFSEISANLDSSCFFAHKKMGIEIVILITNLRFDIVLNIAIKMSEGIYQKRNQLSVRKLLFNMFKIPSA